MPALLTDVVALGALGAVLATMFAHPRPRTEVVVACAAAATVLAVGAVDPDRAADSVTRLLPVVGFLAAVLVVGEACAATGVFAAVGRWLAADGRRHPRHLFATTFLVAAGVTAVLSLDATVVLLTPVVAAAAVLAGATPPPHTFATVRLANSASLLFPVSNLTNLLVLAFLPLTFLEWTWLMAPVWLVVLAVEYVGQRLWFTGLRDAPASPVASAVPPVAAPPVVMPVLPLVVVGLMLVGFAAGSQVGVEPVLVAAPAALVLAGHCRRRRLWRGGDVVRAAHPAFAVLVLGLGIVVAALDQSVLGSVVDRLVPHGTGLVALLGIAALATVLANLLNNLPATLLFIPVVAPLGTAPTLAAIIGLNIGSGLTYPGSLANLLWRRVLVHRGLPPSTREFHLLAGFLTPIAVGAGVVTLWAWTGLVH